jgi:uncharacterized protein YlxP (DUF503 family)
VVKSIVARVRNKFNVSIAEVGGNDSWQSAVIGVACVANSEPRVHGVLTAVVGFIDRSRFDAVLVDYDIEMV